MNNNRERTRSQQLLLDGRRPGLEALGIMAHDYEAFERSLWLHAWEIQDAAYQTYCSLPTKKSEPLHMEDFKFPYHHVSIEMSRASAYEILWEDYGDTTFAPSTVFTVESGDATEKHQMLFALFITKPPSPEYAQQYSGMDLWYDTSTRHIKRVCRAINFILEWLFDGRVDFLSMCRFLLYCVQSNRSKDIDTDKQCIEVISIVKEAAMMYVRHMADDVHKDDELVPPYVELTENAKQAFRDNIAHIEGYLHWRKLVHAFNKEAGSRKQGAPSA